MSDPQALPANVNVIIVEDPLLPLDELEASLNAGVAVFALLWWVGVAIESGEPRRPGGISSWWGSQNARHP